MSQIDRLRESERPGLKKLLSDKLSVPENRFFLIKNYTDETEKDFDKLDRDSLQILSTILRDCDAYLQYHLKAKVPKELLNLAPASPPKRTATQSQHVLDSPQLIPKSPSSSTLHLSAFVEGQEKETAKKFIIYDRSFAGLQAAIKTTFDQEPNTIKKFIRNKTFQVQTDDNVEALKDSEILMVTLAPKPHVCKQVQKIVMYAALQEDAENNLVEFSITTLCWHSFRDAIRTAFKKSDYHQTIKKELPNGRKVNFGEENMENVKAEDMFLVSFDD